jgi:hypothetical protein
MVDNSLLWVLRALNYLKKVNRLKVIIDQRQLLSYRCTDVPLFRGSSL